MKKETKFGIFVSISILVLFFMFFFLGETSFFKKGYNIFVKYKFTNGLGENAPVRVAGVDVGNVEEVKMGYEKDGNLYITVKLWIKKGVSLRKDSKFYINTLGLLGEKYVEITPGNIKSEILIPGSMVRGVDPLSTEQMFSKGNDIVENLQNVLTKISVLLNDDKLGIFITAAKDLSQLLRTADAILVENRKSIKKSVDNLENSTDKLPEIVKNIKKVTEELNKGFKGKGEKIAVSIDQLSEFSKTLKQVSITLEKLNKNLNEKKGNLGKFAYDDKVYKNLEEATKNLNDLIKDIKEHPRRYFKVSLF